MFRWWGWAWLRACRSGWSPERTGFQLHPPAQIEPSSLGLVMVEAGWAGWSCWSPCLRESQPGPSQRVTPSPLWQSPASISLQPAAMRR
ncbi:hypothetical protein CesoFtcFv8_010442 [Champsocephalus esox]|uniref:Uncharacterized protein n=1 Tax=Champsocephalus esox TaxID=159716 RepID=A0AAN8C7I2_9TELE|nr:hypothetical protein CesoFtcFv8_010442 [Champsocephalus esox]